MPIKDIKEKILEDAISEKDQILLEGKRQIDSLKSAFQKEMALTEKNILEDYEREAERKEKNIITEATLDTKKEILFNKQNIIEQVFQEATKQILKMDDKSYLGLLEKLILENVETGNEKIFIGEKERKSVNNIFIDRLNKELKQSGKNGNLYLSSKRYPIIGGVVIGTDEIRKNASIEVLLEKIKEDLETGLSQYLFHTNEGKNA